MPLIWSEELETQLENFLIESIIPTHEQVFQFRVCFKYIVERQDPCTPPDKDWKLSIEAKSLAELLLKANQSWKEKGYNLLKYFFLYRRIKHLSSPKEMIEKIIYDFKNEWDGVGITVEIPGNKNCFVILTNVKMQKMIPEY